MAHETKSCPHDHILRHRATVFCFLRAGSAMGLRLQHARRSFQPLISCRGHESSGAEKPFSGRERPCDLHPGGTWAVQSLTSFHAAPRGCWNAYNTNLELGLKKATR